MLVLVVVVVAISGHSPAGNRAPPMARLGSVAIRRSRMADTAQVRRHFPSADQPEALGNGNGGLDNPSSKLKRQSQLAQPSMAHGRSQRARGSGQ